jgi:hypothetical protein
MQLIILCFVGIDIYGVSVYLNYLVSGQNYGCQLLPYSERQPLELPFHKCNEKNNTIAATTIKSGAIFSLLETSLRIVSKINMWSLLPH